MVLREGLGIAEAARRFSLSPKTPTNWFRWVRGGETLAGEDSDR